MALLVLWGDGAVLAACCVSRARRPSASKSGDARVSVVVSAGPRHAANNKYNAAPRPHETNQLEAYIRAQID